MLIGDAKSRAFVAALLMLLSVAAVPARADEKSRVVVIYNDTDVAMNNFYISNGGLDQDRDVLGPNEVIAPHSSKRLDFDDGSGACLFDLRGVFIDADGHRHAAARNRINVCAVTEVHFTSID